MSDRRERYKPADRKIFGNYEEIIGENIYHLSEVLPTELATGVFVAVQLWKESV